MDKFTVSFTESQIKNLADFIEFNLFDFIRNDDDIDGIRWLCDMCEIYRKLDVIINGLKEGE